MKKILLAGTVMALASASAQADLLFTVGAKASIWDAKPTGQLDNNLSVGGGDGLNLGSDNGTQLTVFFEHPLPFIPNVKLKQTDLKLDGNGNLTLGNFAGENFAGDVATDLDLTHTDITLYWGLPVPFIDINYGLTARIFDGDAEVVGTYNGAEARQREKLDLTLPMLYGEVKVNAPFGLYAAADINWIGFGDNKLMDTSIVGGYTLPVPIVDVAVEVGYRALTLETDRSDVHFESDLDVKGVFYGLSASFGF